MKKLLIVSVLCCLSNLANAAIIDRSQPDWPMLTGFTPCTLVDGYDPMDPKNSQPAVKIDKDHPWNDDMSKVIPFAGDKYNKECGIAPANTALFSAAGLGPAVDGFVDNPGGIKCILYIPPMSKEEQLLRQQSVLNDNHIAPPNLQAMSIADTAAPGFSPMVATVPEPNMTLITIIMVSSAFIFARKRFQ